jgi:starch-binding outer membrane protein, SusD/RagB family
MLACKIKRLLIKNKNEYMKYIKNTGKLMIVAALALLIILPSCKKDFFDVEDPQGIDSDIWNDEGAIGLFLNRTYALIIPQWPTLGGIHNTSDELNNANTAFLYGTLNENSVTDMGTGNGITSNRYFDIRRCNLALEGIDTSKALQEGSKGLLKGQFYFLRAYTYFKMVTLYGGVPLVLKAQQLTNEGIPAVPRAKTSECIAAIAADLDSAAANLPLKWTANADLGRITKAAAMAVKGKVLMYWASPQFNPTNIASRWEDAYVACKAAYDQAIVGNQYSLVSNYANIFTVEDNSEVMIVRKYSTSRDLGTNIENVTRPSSESSGGGGSNQPTWNLVQGYTMNNGLPISHASSGYSTAQFWVNRDPRFAASIVYNGALYPLSGKSDRKQWSYNSINDEGSINTGFYSKRFIVPSLSPSQALYNSNTGGGSGMDWIEMRFAEVILNYAECANETGRMTEAKDMVRKIRQRAGIVAGTFDYGLSLGTDIPTMRSLILNERQVEFALEGKRYYDLRRTRNYNLITARQSYRLSAKLPYVAGNLPGGGPVAGRIYLDVANALGEKPRDTVNVNNLTTYNTVFTVPGTVATIEGSNVVNIPNNYYFYALPNFFSQNTFVIEQTLGWINGTFDPLQ